MNNTSDTILNCQNISKTFTQASQELKVLNGINLTVHRAEKIAIIGSSGSGKTTLLQLLAGLDTPTSGKVSICHQDLAQLTNAQLNLLRNQHLGFVYQFHHLLTEFTALENTAIPLLLNKKQSVSSAKKQAIEMLKKVSLDDRQHHKPSELSGGEKQRVAIARALVTQPSLVFLDEPTGNLDPKTSHYIQELIHTLAKDIQTSFITVTHDMQFAKKMNKTYLLKSCQLNLINIE